MCKKVTVTLICNECDHSDYSIIEDVLSQLERSYYDYQPASITIELIEEDNKNG